MLLDLLHTFRGGGRRHFRSVSSTAGAKHEQRMLLNTVFYVFWLTPAVFGVRVEGPRAAALLPRTQSTLSPPRISLQPPRAPTPRTDPSLHPHVQANNGQHQSTAEQQTAPLFLTIKTLAALSSCEITSGAPTAAIMVSLQ